MEPPFCGGPHSPRQRDPDERRALYGRRYSAARHTRSLQLTIVGTPGDSTRADRSESAARSGNGSFEGRSLSRPGTGRDEWHSPAVTKRTSKQIKYYPRRESRAVAY